MAAHQDKLTSFVYTPLAFDCSNKLKDFSCVALDLSALLPRHSQKRVCTCSNAEEFESERLSASMRAQKAEASAIAAQHELIDVTKR